MSAVMYSKTEVDRDGNKVRIYHQREDGRNRTDMRVTHVWTHDYALKTTCEACLTGRLPVEIRKAPL